MDKSRLLNSLDEFKETPINEIPKEHAMDVIREILKQGGIQPPVEVAKFGSSI